VSVRLKEENEGHASKRGGLDRNTATNHTGRKLTTLEEGAEVGRAGILNDQQVQFSKP